MTVLSLNNLPLGYRFRPTDEELVDFYLRKKINGKDEDVKVIREVDVCKWEPWDLPDLSVVQSNDMEWFFFCPRDQKYPTGQRLNRATNKGYWKATGKDRKIKNRVRELGMKKTLVFYTGRAPTGKRTNWVMHEYRPTIQELDGTHPGQCAFVLCRLFKKQDQSIEDPQGDGVETIVSSPTVTRNSPEDSNSELVVDQATLPLGNQGENQQTNCESCQAEFPDTAAQQALSDGCQDISCMDNDNNAEDEVGDLQRFEMESSDGFLEHFFYDTPTRDPRDFKLFSPVPSQMLAELGPSFGNYPAASNFNDHNGLQFQDDTNDQDFCISDFLDSVLNDSDDNLCEGTGNKNVLPVESETNSFITPISLSKMVAKGGSCSESGVLYPSLKITSGLFQNISLQMAAGIGDFLPVEFEGHKEDVLHGGFFLGQFGNTILEETNSNSIAVGSGDAMDTGIRVRNRQTLAQPRAWSPINQGTAPRRIRLQTKVQVGQALCSNKKLVSCRIEGSEVMSTTTEDRNITEKHAVLSTVVSSNTEDGLQKMTPSTKNMKKGDGLKDTSKKGIFAFSNIHGHRSILSSKFRLKVAVAVVLFAIFVGIGRCLKYKDSTLCIAGPGYHFVQ